jgi:hypothetical protein
MDQAHPTLEPPWHHIVGCVAVGSTILHAFHESRYVEEEKLEKVERKQEENDMWYGRLHGNDNVTCGPHIWVSKSTWPRDTLLAL